LCRTLPKPPPNISARPCKSSKKSTSSLADGPYRVLGYAPGAEAQDKFFESKMTVNPKTGEVIYVAAVQCDTNIDLLTLTKH
jgi:hypothetical protein